MTAAAEPFDERPDVVRAQRGLVVVDGHGLRDRVRLGVGDAALPPQEFPQGGRAAGAQEAPGFKDSVGHGLLRW